MNTRKFPDAEFKRMAPQYEKTLTPAQIKAASEARARINNRSHKQ